VKQRWRNWITDQFHKVFYRFDGAVPWREAAWLGIPVLKCPFDLWVYQEIIHELRPDLVIETGTYQGGSTFFMASILDLIDHGRLISIDIQAQKDLPEHARITYLHGSSTDEGVLAAVERQIDPGDVVMVVLDSDHSQSHVLQELVSYSSFVTLGSYLIVEDTNINGHPVWPDHGPGPLEAVRSFLADDDRFAVDRSREKFYLTFNPHGYLKRIK
jgi:cephalosporin hydroxylase